MLFLFDIMRRLVTTVVARNWGTSHGFVIPVAIVRKMNIQAGETFLVTIEKVPERWSEGEKA